MIKLEEQKLTELKGLARELHIPVILSYWKLEVFDKNGNILQTHRQRSRSWVRNAYNALVTQYLSLNTNIGVYGAGSLKFKDTAGATQGALQALHIGNSVNDPESSVDCTYMAAVATATRGIVVGSDATAWTFEDFDLNTQIVEGAGAGQLNHVASNAPVKTYAALKWTAEWVRFFNNNSGGNVLVKEVGIYSGVFLNAAMLAMLTRDVLGATITLPDTGQLKVTYTIEETLPA